MAKQLTGMYICPRGRREGPEQHTGRRMRLHMPESGTTAGACSDADFDVVGIAMTVLPECSAQGILNISWALSKIDGELLYLSEMDRVAEVTLAKVAEFNSQNVANVAGAFALM
ncbi:hypothetical protein GH714_031492 [Hevea brasiliensis]|uniref:Uncharacterized protein n=1 Tax=Hevea brasiliensis TaxID=3981 RepID=A0A6A6NL71_HEVBR|nr:hypothetical protein GH714_031492 [Hevea brasiliensis]